jgi:hypothetical protein
MTTVAWFSIQTRGRCDTRYARAISTVRPKPTKTMRDSILGNKQAGVDLLRQWTGDGDPERTFWDARKKRNMLQVIRRGA